MTTFWGIFAMSMKICQCRYLSALCNTLPSLCLHLWGSSIFKTTTIHVGFPTCIALPWKHKWTTSLEGLKTTLVVFWILISNENIFGASYHLWAFLMMPYEMCGLCRWQKKKKNWRFFLLCLTITDVSWLLFFLSWHIRHFTFFTSRPHIRDHGPRNRDRA